MGKVKTQYCNMIQSKKISNNVPIEYTMYGKELEEYQFLSMIDGINSELQICAQLNEQEND